MIWEQEPCKKSEELSHGFSNHPFTNNSKFNDECFVSCESNSYSPELWHYGILGMKWGVITKDRENGVGYNRSSIASSSNKSAIKETPTKIAKLKNIKRKMQQRRAKIYRFGNKVITKMKPLSEEEKQRRREQKAEALYQKYYIDRVDKINDVVDDPSKHLKKLLKMKV